MDGIDGMGFRTGLEGVSESGWVLLDCSEVTAGVGVAHSGLWMDMVSDQTSRG
jgi:hypothetical protein